MTSTTERERRIPPNDTEAEKCVLGAMMVSEFVIPEVHDLIGEKGDDYFFRPAHQMIYDAIISTFNIGTPPDAVVVAAELTRRDELARTGGLPYLLELIQAVPTAASAGHYAQIVVERAHEREVVALSDRLYADNNPAAARDLVTSWLEEDDARQSAAGPRAAEPEFVLLDEFLEVEDEPIRYRIADLLTVGGRVVVAAQFKAGKTTLRDNVVRALVDKEDFLGRFPVNPPEGRVVIIDNELDERMMRHWLRDQHIVNTNRVAVLSLRGKVYSFDILDSAVRTRWANKLRALDASVVIFDCLRPVLDALGLDENKDAGRFIIAFDALLDEAGAEEGMLVHHMGHSGERSRGDSRILDWPDVTWKLLRPDPDPSSPRFFSAFGRDVDVPEGRLEYAREGRRLTLTEGSRSDAAAESLVALVVDAVTSTPGLSQNALCKHVPGDDHKIRAARDLAISRNLIHQHHGANRSKTHHPGVVGCGAVGCTTPSGGVVGAVYKHLTTAPPQDPIPAAPHHTEEPRERLSNKDGVGTGLCATCGGRMTKKNEDQTTHHNGQCEPCPDCHWTKGSNGHKSTCGAGA